MRTILIYSGTTEGRTIAEIAARAGISCDVCVATEYGKQVMEPNENINILEGRLTTEQMRELYDKNSYEAVIDATHPFATVVSENIRNSLEGYDIPLYRLLREIEDDKSSCITVKSIDECIKLLKAKEGRILLTTGSKDLHAFCADEELKSRIVARVLPGKESIDICYDNGLEGKQIVAMQGPFSKDMNKAIIGQYDISVMVTKESGKTGGVDEKVLACMEAGIDCIMIEKPSDVSIKAYSMDELCKELGIANADETVGTKPRLRVYLIGIGMGQYENLSVEAADVILNADYIFGAERMIASARGKGEKYPYYLSKDILPALEGKTGTVAVLLSGDTGFYSGCEKLYKAIKDMDDVETKILPGTSSLSALSAKTGISWQDANLISCHGTEERIWIRRISESARYNAKTFFLTSGYKDIQTIGELLLGLENVEIVVGRQLGYEDEKILRLTPAECANVSESGLYVGMIVNASPDKRSLGPVAKDDDFIRDKVPMTKEEVRQVSICKLGLNPDSVVYDVGAGSGSIAIEMARLSCDMDVYAIETNPVAVELIGKNIEKFGVKNVTVVEALAPEGFEELPAPTHAFIGGSKGNLIDILKALKAKNPTMRVVINAISLETICELNDVMKEFLITNDDITMINVSKAKKLGDYNLMQANNPVYIFAFNFK